MPIRNVLVTTDFSPASLLAVHYAAGWARGLGAALHVANFIQPTELTVAAGFGPGMDLEALLDSARRGLRAIAEDPLLAGLPLTTHVREAEVADGLPELIAELHLDLVVSASSGRRGLGKLVLGSTAEAIFRRVPGPVLPRPRHPARRPASAALHPHGHRSRPRLRRRSRRGARARPHLAGLAPPAPRPPAARI